MTRPSVPSNGQLSNVCVRSVSAVMCKRKEGGEGTIFPSAHENVFWRPFCGVFCHATIPSLFFWGALSRVMQCGARFENRRTGLTY